MTSVRPSRRRRLAVVLVGLVASASIVATAATQETPWRIALDLAEETCLPYRVYAIRMGEVDPQRGDFVAFRATGLEPHFVDGSLFTKQVLGVPGDRVVVGFDGATVNGTFLAFTDRAIKKLGIPRAARVASYTLGQGELFMAGTEPGAFDSRYYGPVRASALVGSSRPLL
ncbi:MAG: hypothetical protein A2580_15000 [Hydrogenophilales bacterium RIFOXYD1_FULL_62_11]|nr:MAG: hypothetical protein A2580_15000 [Hydrogenophilales bacterium RIFOXYD1_FULL_62_11]